MNEDDTYRELMIGDAMKRAEQLSELFSDDKEITPEKLDEFTSLHSRMIDFYKNELKNLDE